MHREVQVPRIFQSVRSNAEFASKLAPTRFFRSPSPRGNSSPFRRCPKGKTGRPSGLSGRWSGFSCICRINRVIKNMDVTREIIVMTRYLHWTEDDLQLEIRSLSERIAEASESTNASSRAAVSYLNQVLKDRRDQLAVLRRGRLH